jgi:hypothetical protein
MIDEKGSAARRSLVNGQNISHTLFMENLELVCQENRGRLG